MNIVKIEGGYLYGEGRSASDKRSDPNGEVVVLIQMLLHGLVIENLLQELFISAFINPQLNTLSLLVQFVSMRATVCYC